MINESLYLLRVYGVRGVKINPTRKNVLGNKFLNMIVGGVNMFATNPLPINTKTVNSHPLKTIFQHKACTDKLYADSFYKVQKNSHSSFEVICCCN